MSLPPLDQPLSWKNGGAAVATLLDDLQANILKGHGRIHTVNLFFSFDTNRPEDVKAAIHQLSGGLKTAKQQLAQAEAFKTTKKDGGTVRCFFLTFEGYKALGIEGKAPPTAADSAFQTGMKSRTDLSDAKPDTWDTHFQKTIHAMLLLADDDTARLKAECESAVNSLTAAGFDLLGQEQGDQQHNARGDGVEHFGYVDGRSQPLLLAEDVEHEAQGEDGVSMWNPAFPPAQVLVVSEEDVAGSVLGSFFVFRKLEQNVKRFKHAEEEVAKALGLKGSAAELAGALMVGRFEDGTPVVLRKQDGIGGDVPNNFNYDDDLGGAKCPLHAHVRKTNPRGTGGFGQPHLTERGHIMARRGITYGEREKGMEDRPEKGVGLLFMSYQTSLENQFEFTQQTWANNPDFPESTTTRPGIDPVIGQGANPPNTQHCPLSWGDAGKGTVANDFGGSVTMKGGEYFFAPVISALRNL